MNITHKGLRDAVQSLINSHPLFAGILLQQKFIETDAIPTAAVNGKEFRFNPDFMDSLDFDSSKGLAAHEACHLLGGHHFRMGSRDCSAWNQACDYVINGEIVRSGLKLPQGALIDPRFDGQSAEMVYRTIYAENPPKPRGKKPGDKPGDRQGDQDGNGSDRVLGDSCGQIEACEGDLDQAEAESKVQIQQAASIARLAGSLSADQARQIEKDLSPRYDWREILHRYFQEVTANDYSFTRPNKRFAGSGLILPSLYSRDVGRIVLAVDTSGSISTAEVSAMVAEMQNCTETYCEQGIGAALKVIYCDSEVRGVEELLPGDQPNPRGGGGTAFKPVFDHLQGDLEGAAALVYLTDGYSSDVSRLEDPGYPVLWGLIVDNESFNPPFGETFRFDVHA